MEVKINREIRNYTESMFFGLSMRQFFFSVAAMGIAVLLYFLLKPHFGTETVSWMCLNLSCIPSGVSTVATVSAGPSPLCCQNSLLFHSIGSMPNEMHKKNRFGTLKQHISSAFHLII